MKTKLLSILLILSFVFYGTISADWVKMNGQSVGSVSAIAELDGKIFVGNQKGVLRSDDGGQNWVTLTTGISNLYVTAIEIVNETIFIGTRDNGVYTSNNLGATWTYSSLGLENFYIKTLASSGGDVFVGTLGGGIFKSTNYGNSWEAVNSGMMNPNVYSLYVAGDKIYATTTEGGVYVSDLSTINWLSIGAGLPLDFTVRSITKSGTNLIIGTEIGAFYTYDHGAHWVAGNIGLTTNDIFILKTVDNKVFAGSNEGGVYRSTNDGISWESINETLMGNNINCIGYVNNQLMAGIQAGGLFTSSDYGDTWTSLIESSMELNNPQPRRFLLTGDKLFVANYGGKVYLSRTLGETWEDITAGVVCDNAYSLTELDSFVFLGTDNGIYRTNKDVISWEKVGNFISGAFFVRNGTIFIGTRYMGIYSSTDLGETWQSRGLDGEIVMVFAANDNYIYAGTSNNCYYSTNDGNSWTSVGTGSFPSWINNMIIKDNYVYAGTHYNGIRRAELGSSEWTQLEAQYSWPPVVMLAQYKEFIIVGTIGSGLLISNDNGNSFAQLNNGLPMYATCYAFTYNQSYLFAGVLGGIYRQDVVENLMNLVDVEDEEEIIVTDFVLNQNYPNPFNPSTTISFSIANTENVTLKIYDAVGKEIASLVDEQMQPGFYQKQWDASGYASGVYFYRLQAGNFSSTKKLMLVK